jgi:hypothetical protein
MGLNDNKERNEKNEVYMLEQQATQDLEKPVPIVGKQDYSGAHEVRFCSDMELSFVFR